MSAYAVRFGPQMCQALGTLPSQPKSDISDFGWGREQTKRAAHADSISLELALVRPSRLHPIADQLDQLLRRDRRLGDVNAKGLQRVLDGGDHRGRGRNGADLAGAFGAERIER